MPSSGMWVKRVSASSVDIANHTNDARDCPGVCRGAADSST